MTFKTRLRAICLPLSLKPTFDKVFAAVSKDIAADANLLDLRGVRTPAGMLRAADLASVWCENPHVEPYPEDPEAVTISGTMLVETTSSEGVEDTWVATGTTMVVPVGTLGDLVKGQSVRLLLHRGVAEAVTWSIHGLEEQLFCTL